MRLTFLVVLMAGCSATPDGLGRGGDGGGLPEGEAAAGDPGPVPGGEASEGGMDGDVAPVEVDPGEGEGEPAQGEGEVEPPDPTEGEGEGDPVEPSPARPVCEPGIARCVGDSVEICVEDGLSWTVREVCALACRGGVCLDPACEADERRCMGDELEVCADDQLGWRFRRDCTAGCVQSACADPVCRPFDRDCQGQVPRSCDARGRAWLDGEACSDRCEAGHCVADGAGECPPGAARCRDAGREVCSAAGFWEVVGQCPFACLGGGCVQCRPGGVRCQADIVQTCQDDGDAWVNDEVCELACIANRCAACTPGQPRCSDDPEQEGLIEVCGEAGQRWSPSRRCETLCVEGACTACAPGQRRCDGDAVEVCEGDGGTWAVAEICEAGCEAGACPCAPDRPEVPGNEVDDDCDGDVDEPISLSVRQLRVLSDDWAGPEVGAGYGGRGNSLVDAGERVEFVLSLRNTTGLMLLGGDATILSDTDGVEVVQGAATGDYPPMLPGAEAELDQVFAITVSPDLPDSSIAMFEVRYFDSLLGPLGASRFSTTVRDVSLTLENIAVDDDGIGFSDGDGNGRADPGEPVELRLSLRTTAGLPLHTAPDDANPRSMAAGLAVVGVQAEDPPGWMTLRGPEFDQRWNEADPLSLLIPPAVFFVDTHANAPPGALSCVNVRYWLGDDDGPPLYAFERPACVRVSDACSADDGDEDGLSCQQGDCDDGDANAVNVDDEVSCDGQDEDCDGTVDENWDVDAACDPPGECGAGLLECNVAGDDTVCSTGPAGTASEVALEVCDNVDNDCDGERDEDDGEGGRCQAACPGAAVLGYCWIKATQPDESQAAACQRVGLRQSPGDVDVAWNEATMNQVAAGIGCNSIGDFGCCAQGMWVFANNDCGTHNFGPHFNNFGPFSGHFPVYTCHLD